MPAPDFEREPRAVLRDAVRAEWIDRNGHFNAGATAQVFDQAIGDWLDRCGMNGEHRARHRSATFTAESHILYLRELHEGAPIVVTAQLLAYDAKRMHTFLRLHHAKEGFLASTNEVLSLHVDMTTRRVAPFPDELRANFAAIARLQEELAVPAQVGRVMGVTTPAPRR
jgi:acyl-CoA thioester hydrolase